MIANTTKNETESSSDNKTESLNGTALNETSSDCNDTSSSCNETSSEDKPAAAKTEEVKKSTVRKPTTSSFKGVDVTQVDNKLKSLIEKKKEIVKKIKPVKLAPASISRNGAMKINFNQDLHVPDEF